MTRYIHDSIITLLNHLLKRNEAHTHTEVRKIQTLTLFMRASLLIRAPKWKQPKLVPTDQQMQTPRCNHTIK